MLPPQELYRKDCNLAVQLLQCNKSLYRAQLSEVRPPPTLTSFNPEAFLEPPVLYPLPKPIFNSSHCFLCSLKPLSLCMHTKEKKKNSFWCWHLTSSGWVDIEGEKKNIFPFKLHCMSEWVVLRVLPGWNLGKKEIAVLTVMRRSFCPEKARKDKRVGRRTRTGSCCSSDWGAVGELKLKVICLNNLHLWAMKEARFKNIKQLQGMEKVLTLAHTLLDLFSCEKHCSTLWISWNTKKLDYGYAVVHL